MTDIEQEARAEAVRTGAPEVQLLACAECGVLLWDIDAHYRQAHATGPASATRETVTEERIDAATYALCDYDTDLVDRGGPTEAHWQERRGDVLRVLAALGLAEPERAQEDEFAPGECQGHPECDVPVHVHGCFADVGNCDEPDEHPLTEKGDES